MASKEKSPTQDSGEQAAKPVVSAAVPQDVKAAIQAEAKAADRSESYIIAAILTPYYRKGLARRVAGPLSKMKLAA